MTRIETLKAQVIELQTTYEKDMYRLEKIISERAEEVFSMIDLTKFIYTDDVVCRMIYNLVTETGLIKKIEYAYEKGEELKTIIRMLESEYRRPVTFDIDFYNYSTDKDAKAIEDCIIKLYYLKSKVSVYRLGITDYTHKLIDRERAKREKNS